MLSRFHRETEKLNVVFAITPTTIGIEWPSWEEILKAQMEFQNIPDMVFQDSEGFYKTEEGQTFVPTDNLRNRIMIIAHTSKQGHQRFETTLKYIQEHFWWPDLEEDVRLFLRLCLHCIPNKRG